MAHTTIIVLVILALIFFGGLGFGHRYGGPNGLGYGGGIGLGTIVVILLILWLLGII